MKKYLIPMLFLATGFIISCGPSAEERAAEELRLKDSIATAEKAKADSVIAAMADSVATADSLRLAAQAVEDSIAAVSSARPKTKPKSTATTPPPSEPKNMKDAMGGGTKDTTNKPKNMKDAMKK